jgi:hypothetical protein
VFPPLIDALASHPSGTAPKMLRDVLAQALEEAITEHPELCNAVWKVRVLEPAVS